MTSDKHEVFMAITKKEIEFFDGIQMVTIPSGAEIWVDMVNSIAEYKGICFFIDSSDLIFYC